MWPAGGLRYRLRRGFRARGGRVVVSGRATGEDALMPSNLHENFRLGPLELRGEVRFSDRGLEASSMTLDYEVEVGDFPGLRRTSLRFERLD